MAERVTRAQHRAAAEKIVERIAGNPAYRRALLDDPTEALETLLGLDYEAVEVAGYGVFRPRSGCEPTCPTVTCKSICGGGERRTCADTCNVTNAPT